MNKSYQSRYRSNSTGPPPVSQDMTNGQSIVNPPSAILPVSTGMQQPKPTAKPDGSPKVNGKTSGVPYADILNVMTPKPTATEPSPIDYRALLEKARVLPTDVIDKPVGCLAIGQEDDLKMVGTLGNITTFTGKAKAKKTFVITMAIAAAVANKLILGRIKGLLDPGSVVLLFDTEQSRYHVLRIVKRICRLVGIDDPPSLIVYSLRPFSPEERLKAIDWALNNTPGVKAAVIDGVRDLAIDPITDSEDASTIMTHLLKWSDTLNIHIMTVLHQNKNDTNVRGHLGTELVNKSETVISVSRDMVNKDISVVAPEFCRDVEFEGFRFSVDETGLPILIDDGSSGASEQPELLKKKAKPTVDSMTSEIIESIVNRALGGNEYLSYGQLLTNIIEASEFAGVSLAKTRAETFIQRVTLQGLLVQFKPPKSRHNAYRLPFSTDLNHAP